MYFFVNKKVLSSYYLALLNREQNKQKEEITLNKKITYMNFDLLIIQGFHKPRKSGSSRKLK